MTPTNITFLPREQTIYIARTHWIYLLTPAFGFIITLILPLFFMSTLQYLYAFLPFPTQFIKYSESILSITFLFVNLFAFLSFFRTWVNHYLDVWILTNDRVIDAEQIAFFKREVAVLRYEHIEDIKVNVSGLLKTFIDIGDITIQTAAEHREFIFTNVENPYYVKSIIEHVVQTRYNDEHRNV